MPCYDPRDRDTDQLNSELASIVCTAFRQGQHRSKEFLDALGHWFKKHEADDARYKESL